MLQTIFGAVLAASAFCSTGCVARTIVSFEDHPAYPVTDLEVFETKSYWVYQTHEHQFYSCADAGDKLVCKRTCGPKLDIQCPSDVATGYGAKSNVR